MRTRYARSRASSSSMFTVRRSKGTSDRIRPRTARASSHRWQPGRPKRVTVGTRRIVARAARGGHTVGVAVPFLRVLKGKLTVVGKSPDGDSIRFVPAKPELIDDLYRGDRARPSRVDGSFQLRLEGIDSPETHYGKDAQPQGEPARDWLLEQAGFTNVV